MRGRAWAVAVLLASLPACDGGAAGDAARASRSPLPVELDVPTPVQSPTPEPSPPAASAPKARKAETTAYVSQVCRGLRGWMEGIDADARRLWRDAVTANLKVARAALVGFLRRAARSSDAFVAFLARTEPPRVPYADEQHDALVAGFEEARDVFAAAYAEARTLPVSSPASFQSGAKRLGRSITSAQDDIRAVFKKAPPGRAIGRAFERAPACAPLDETLGVDDTVKV